MKHNNTSTHPAKPFVKWAGGKSQILSEIRAEYPSELGGRVDKYAEPFIGGGAVLFDVLNHYQLNEIYIGDINRELIYTYLTIRDDVGTLINTLKFFEKQYLPSETAERKNIYYTKRERFNKIKSACDKTPELAALFIFLNRVCFNGLYRVNSAGMYNVSHGRYQNPCICDEANLRAVSDKLKGVTVVCGDYRLAHEFIDNKTFAYFDPPYRPLSSTSSFTAYAQSRFDDTAQIELARFIDEMSDRGARVVASNSDPTNADLKDKFFDKLYARYKISRIEANRAINSIGGGRGRIRELLIKN